MKEKKYCFAQGDESPMTVHAGLSIIYRHGRVMRDRAMRQYGLSGQQMAYLKYVYDNPGVSQEELVKLLKIDKGAVTKSIRDMAEKGYVIRNHNPQDKRAYCLFLTEGGQKICQEAEHYLQEFEKKLTKDMTAQEMKTFKILLKKMTHNMEEMMKGGDI